MQVSWTGPTIDRITARRVTAAGPTTDSSSAGADNGSAANAVVQSVEVSLTMGEAGGLHMHGTADCVACCSSVASSPIMLGAVSGDSATGQSSGRLQGHDEHAGVGGATANCDLLGQLCPGEEGRNASCFACTNAHASELNKTKGCTAGLISDWCLKRRPASDCSFVLNSDCPGEEGKNESCTACVAAHATALRAAGCSQALLKDWCVSAPTTPTGVRATVSVSGSTITATASLTAAQLPPNATHVEVLFQFENYPQCSFYSGGASDGPQPHGVYEGSGLVANQARFVVPLA